jgi:antirestriction protein ArdC
LRAGPTRLFRAPRETGAEKEKKQMNEQIQQTHRGQLNGGGSLQARIGDALTSAKRKPLVSWAALLDEAVKKPGFIHEAYNRFHNYSLGNQLLALFQCFERGIRPGPLATFPKWKELGRYVKRGEKALTVCIPLTCKRTKTVKKDDGTDQEEEFSFSHFTYKAHCSCAD